MFLAAALGIGESTTQCRIRNVTGSGAMIESSSKVSVGTTVIITRGKLCVAGEVKWLRENLFGVKFSAQIGVQDWLDEPFSTHPLPTFRTRTSCSGTKITSCDNDDVDLDENTINGRLAEELFYVSRIVEEIGQVLVKDSFLRVRHSASLQQLDIGQQMLSEIAQLVSKEDKLGRISQVATGSMRGRLLRAKPL